MVIASLLAACTADNAGPPKTVASVAVAPLTSPLPVGSTLQLTATPQDANGNPLSGRSVTWSSSDSGVATVSSSGVASGISLGSATIMAKVDGIAGTASVTVTAGAASQLSFTGLPTALVAGVVITPPIVVTARDVGGNVATGFAGNVTISLGTNPSGGTLMGTTTIAAGGGIATFADLHIDKSGSGYTFQAASGSLATSASPPVTISPAQAVKLVFTAAPSTAVAGSAIAPAVQVAAADQFGNTVPSFADSIGIVFGSNPVGGTLSGTKRVLALNGIASFADLSIDRAGAGYTLTATTTSLPSGTSTSFAVGPATPSATVSTLTVSPTTIISSTGSSAATITATVRDAYGNPVPGVNVTVAATGSGDNLIQPAAPTNAAGVALASLSATISESKIVSAKAGTLSLAQTDTVTVTPANGGALFFTVQPSAAGAGAAIAPAVEVTAKDPFGNVSTGFTGMVTLAIANNPGGGTLGGTLAKPAVAGVAQFNDLRIDKSAAGYVLSAVATGMTTGTSAPFNINPGAVSATQSTVGAAPTSITASTGSSATTITVTVRDALGNPVPGVTVALAATGSGNALTQPSGQTSAAGVASGILSSTVSEVKIISATAGPVALTQTDTLTVNPASGGALAFTVQPSATAGGGTIAPPVTVTAKDQFGNVSSSFTGTVTVAIVDNPSGGSLSGTLSEAAVAGVASFNDLAIDKPGVGYTLGATATGVTAAKSATFTITPGVVSAAKTTVTASPSPITASNGANAATITVTARDAAGNPISGATVQLVATGGGNTLVQPAGVTSAAGTANGTISSTASGDKTITATVNGIAITQQATVTVNSAAATGAQTTIAAAPASIAASNGGFTSTITVTAKDAFGNGVSGATVVLSATGGGNTVVQPAGSTNAGGVATGSLSSTLVGTKTVSATVNGLPVTATTTVTVVPGEVSVSQSTIVAATGTITASTGASADTFTIAAKDDQGNVIPGVPVVLAATGSANVFGQPAVTDANGIAKGTLRSTVAETKIVSATIDGTGIDRVDTVAVVAAGPVGLAFVVQPSNAIAGVAMSPTVQVEVRDAFANRVTSPVNPITLALNKNLASLTGNGPVAAVNGLATFPALTVNTGATGYTLAASATGLSGTVSGTFNVSTGVVSASQSTVAVSPASIVAGGGSSAITVTVRDGSGTPLPGVTVTLSASGSNTIVQPSGLTNASGVASGSLSSTSAGVKTVTATASGVVINQKPVITVTAAAIDASQSTVQAIPTTVVVNSPSTISVKATDQFGNPVGGATVHLSATGSGVSVTQPTAATDASGVATGSVKASSTGTVTVSATAGGVALTQTASVTVEAVGASVVFIGAGDIADCGNDNDAATAALITAIPSVPVFTLGDNAYPNGSTNDYKNCYNPTWGAFKSRTHPSAGNHEYDVSSTAAPYFAYFGASAGTAGQGYYSFDLGSWHVVVLNSNIATDPGSPQELWLKADLAAHPNVCTLAYWHHPLYSSIGGSTGTSGAVITSARPLWDDLYAAGVDLVLNGHRHVYERLAPMKPDGSPDPVKGIRTIIAGMGGESGGDLTNIFPTSEVREGRTFGILKLTLTTGSYSWQFIGVPGSTFTDSGTNSCH
ncbi:MAG TPA: Ig-like domain-containing protein [Gemmatimonadales bacterium]|nr:Ig-like domain-containing protein [Gemmatimonadales bacterium]